MAATAETIAITKVLLALINAVHEIQQALAEMAPEKNEAAMTHLRASVTAGDELLDEARKLVEILQKSHG